MSVHAHLPPGFESTLSKSVRGMNHRLEPGLSWDIPNSLVGILNPTVIYIL